MTTIYTLLNTISYHNADFTLKTSTTYAVGAFATKETVKAELLNKLNSYTHRLEENKYNRIKLTDKSLTITIYNTDDTYTEYKYTYTDLELQ